MDKMTENLLKQVADEEGVELKTLVNSFKEGKVAVFKNIKRDIKPVAVGEGLRVKVNANIGTSKRCSNIKKELEKVAVCEEAGADAIMDLSTGGDLSRIRKEIIASSRLPIGTVPIYELACDLLVKKKKGIESMDFQHFLDIMEKQAEEGVDFMTIHCGLTYHAIERLDRAKRSMGVVSRGGSLIVEWMKKNKKENPLYENFDELMKVAKRYNIVLSLGDGLRPGSTLDATDRPQIDELIILGELVDMCRKEGVQVIVEGPGHVPLNQIETNIKLQKSLCKGAPFYVLGPLVTDIGAGYDHLVSAIGGALAAYFGADFLCYVTPAEHLRLPDLEDVREGVVAAKIAAHAADLARGNRLAWEREKKMAKARYDLNWKEQVNAAISPKKAKAVLGDILSSDEPCTMCDELCAIKTSKRAE
ncbi:MAG: phosphomethylpyrimidine synthase [bacterium]